MAPECLSSSTSFSLKKEFLGTSNSLVRCILHQNIIVFIQVLYANAMKMSKLNLLLETTMGSDKKDPSNLTIGCIQKLFLEGETHPQTEVFKSHLTPVSASK